jgi:hypothetical protein
MRPTTIRDYAAKYDRDPDNCFAAACFNQNSIPELLEGLSDGPDLVTCKTWGITLGEWRDAIYAALHERAGGGFAVTLVRHRHNGDAIEWYEDEDGARSQYGDRTVFYINKANAIRTRMAQGLYELLDNESSRPDVYITTVRDMERVRDGEVSWKNGIVWRACPCAGSQCLICTTCSTCIEVMNNAEIEYIRKHAIQ